MKLKSLEIMPAGAAGWRSRELHFGEPMTSLYAPNGSGKTPIIQSIAFCLGYPVTFREEIYTRCQAAVLTTDIKGERVVFRREFRSDLMLNVEREGHDSVTFTSERALAAALCQMLDLPFPALVGSDKKETHPYLSTLLPLFYVDQDLGYFDLYKAPRSFISDQFVEMIRVCFGLSPRHSYDARGALIEAKESLAALDRRIVAQQSVINDLSSRTDDSEQTKNAAVSRAREVNDQLTALQSSVSLKGGAAAALENIRGEQGKTVTQLRQQLSDLRLRIDGIGSIRQEIETEMKTLALNEESRRVFVSFQEVCANPDCGLFLGSVDSYGKNLMYLKDQLKDLERNAAKAVVRASDLAEKLEKHETDLRLLDEKITKTSKDGEIGQLLSAIQLLTKEAFEVGQRLSAIDILKGERSKLLRLENERSRVQDQIALLSSAGRADLEFNHLRYQLQALVVKWLDILQTKNVPREVSIDLEFRFLFGNEPFGVFKGSTKTRVILAVHAAIFELYLADAARPLRFLILDTPRQQDMQTGDLAQYLAELSRLCVRADGQFVISSTEYRHPKGTRDAEWLPDFDGFAQPMYLGRP